MQKNKILVVADNSDLFKGFKKIIERKKYKNLFSFACSKVSKHNEEFNQVKCLDLKNDDTLKSIIADYFLVISLHAKQLFPKKLVKKIRCINVHPGFNPFNRGMFPHVFSIINGFPLGVTIHEMDEYIDHGPIIIQEKLDDETWEDSFEIYNRLLKLELKLLKENLDKIINHEYKSVKPSANGNINFIKDFKSLCNIDLSEKNTFENFINRLRALSHDEYKNAYFIDKDINKKVYLKISFTLQDQSS